MYIESESREVITKYNKMIKERSKKIQKIWVSILLVVVGILVILALIPGLLNNETGVILYGVYGGMTMLFLVIAVTVSFVSVSDKPAFNYLYKEIYDKINLEKGTFYEYTPFEKGDFDFNKRSGLFSKHARASVYRHVKGVSPNDNIFEIFDTILITGGGKNKTVHFNGIYCTLKYSSSSLLQIRSHSKPRLSGVKFERVEEEEKFKVFIEEGNRFSYNEEKYLDTMSRLKTDLKAKKIYLSITNDEIHFAYVPKTHIRKQTNLSTNRLNDIYSDFLYEIQYLDELMETSEF